ncbi:GCN5-related N-acetyltransferase [Calothrix sp. NIES-4071]|nr:GCN5-related N-acetyltransferase [Calothrix sp. NIES-4071]BAZ56433.1 GCN5-related N-acetyltransferase [Calothrix sp. NIES-4105]
MRVIELLDKHHDRDSFDCGSEALNKFIKQTARQHIQKGISRTFVLIETEQPTVIIGFLTLTLCEIRALKLPLQFSKKYPSKVPGVKLARLAVDQAYQRQRIGEILMIEAMKRAKLVAENAGGIGLFVDAKDEFARNYYERYGFVNLKDLPLELFLPLSTIVQKLE